MRALTVRQPWAGSIIHHGKSPENRTRNVAGSYRGPLAIHVSQRHDYEAQNGPFMEIQGGIDQFNIYGHGCVIGVVDLVDVHPAEQVGSSVSVWADWCCSPWGQRDAVHLALANPRPIEPIACRGALGLWNTPGHVTAWIKDQLRSAS